jgi:antitoxin MazE
MRTNIQKWGNSLAVRIPKAFASDLGIDQNAPVDLSMEDGALVLRPALESNYSLDNLLAQVTDDNIHPVVDWGAPVGKEVL